MARWPWFAIIFAIIASIVQPFAPLWLFMALILASLVATATGLLLAQRRWRKQALIAAMDNAFSDKPRVEDWIGP